MFHTCSVDEQYVVLGKRILLNIIHPNFTWLLRWSVVRKLAISKRKTNFLCFYDMRLGLQLGEWHSLKLDSSPPTNWEIKIVSPLLLTFQRDDSQVFEKDVLEA